MSQTVRSVAFARNRRQTPPEVIQIVRSKEWNKFRLLSGIFLILFAALLSNWWFTSRSVSIDVVSVNTNLAAGSLLSPSDLSYQSITGSKEHVYVTDINDVVGERVRRDLFVGELLPMNAVSRSANAELRIVSIPIAAGHVPLVDVGQLVDVWVTPSLDSAVAPGPARLVLENAVVEENQADLDPTMDTVISLAVARTDVQVVVAALQEGAINLVVVPNNLRGLS